MAKTTAGPSSVIFDGTTGANNDLIEGSLGSNGSRSRVTVEMWARLEDQPNLTSVFSWDEGNNVNNYNVLFLNSGELGFNTWRSEVYGINASAYKNVWTHFVFVSAASSVANDQKIYVNGVQQSLSCVFSASPPVTPNACNTVARTFPSSGAFTVMANAKGRTTQNAKGRVGLVRIYDSELTAAEVLANYTATSPTYVDAGNAVSVASIAATHTTSSSVGVAYTATDDIDLTGIEAFYSPNADLTSPVSCGTATAITGLSATGTINCTLASPVSRTTYYFFTRATDWSGAVEAAPTSADDTIIYDVSAPTATWTTPSSPANSRTLSYTLAFGESVSGIAASDFSNTGTATDCTFTPSAASGSSITVAVTCATDGTVIAKIDASSVTDAAGNAGPTAASSATSVTIDTTPATTTTTTTTTVAATTTTTTQPKPTAPSDKIIRSLPVKELVTSETVEPGATLKIAVGGFTPNETVAVGIAGSKSALTSAIADSTGDITARVAIPSSATGRITVFALGQTSKRGFKQIVTLQLPATGTDASAIPSVAIGFVLLGLLFVSIATRRRLRTE